MSRPVKATVDYFPHFSKNSKTLFTIESKYGNDGYAFWFKLLEVLAESEHHFIDCNKIEVWEFLIAKTKITEEKAIDILNLLAKLDAIDLELWQNKIIRSENFILNLSSLYKRREIDVWNKPEVEGYCIQKPLNKDIIVDKKPQSKGEKRKGEKRREKENEIEYSLTENKFIILSDNFKQYLNDLFENIDWELEVAKMEGWLSSNPKKVSGKNWKLFFIHWFEKKYKRIDKGKQKEVEEDLFAIQQGKAVDYKKFIDKPNIDFFVDKESGYSLRFNQDKKILLYNPKTPYFYLFQNFLQNNEKKLYFYQLTPMGDRNRFLYNPESENMRSKKEIFDAMLLKAGIRDYEC